MVSFKNFCVWCFELDFDVFWGKDFGVELYYFIGKDIVNFYVLFWLVMFEGVGYCKLIVLNVYGYLIVNGQKMFKLCGIFVKVCIYFDYLDLEYLCYYYVFKFGCGVEDFDLNFEDFVQKVNFDLVGKVVNIVSCCVGFIYKGNVGVLVGVDFVLELFVVFCEVVLGIVEVYEVCDFNCVMCEIMVFVDCVNVWIVEQVFWVLVKQEGQQDKVQVVCGLGINLFCQLVIFFKLVLLKLVVVVEVFFNVVLLIWVDYWILLVNY